MADVLYGVTKVGRVSPLRAASVDSSLGAHGVTRPTSLTDHKPISLETPTAGRSVEAEEAAPHKREEQPSQGYGSPRTLEIMMAK